MITGVWALAFGVMVAAQLTLLYTPGLSPRAGIIVIILALVGAVKFTGWYPEHVRNPNDFLNKISHESWRASGPRRFAPATTQLNGKQNNQLMF